MARSKVLRVEFEKDVGSDPGLGYTLPARYYLEPEVFEREKQAIFYRGWHYIAGASQLAQPGDYATLRIADENVFVIRDKDGGLRGFYNVCKHRAHELLDGAGNTKVIVCPYHAWAYDLDGGLRSARKTESVAGFRKEDFCLTPLRVEMLCGFVFVNLDPGAEPLAVQAAGLAKDLQARIPRLDEFRPVESFSLSSGGVIEAGWKVVVDNFLECYHCAPAHPAFADMIDMQAYRVDAYDIWSRQVGPETRPENDAYDFDPEAPYRSGLFWYIWPTTTINLVPGSGHLGVASILPAGPERTAFQGHRYLLPGTGPEVAAAAGYLNDILGPEDQGLCESVQRGLKSKSYNQGRFVVDPGRGGTAEHAVHHFHRLVLEALED